MAMLGREKLASSVVSMGSSDAPQAIPRAAMHALAQRIQRFTEDATREMLMIGTALNQIRPFVPHGEWTKYIKVDCAIKVRSANNYMRAATRFGSKSEMVAHLPPGVIYALANDKITDEQVALVIRESEIKTLDLPAVKALINSSKNEAEPRPQKATTNLRFKKLLDIWHEFRWADDEIITAHEPLADLKFGAFIDYVKKQAPSKTPPLSLPFLPGDEGLDVSEDDEP